MRSPHGRILENLINEYLIPLKENLSMGTAPDYATYRQMVGQIQGLTDALALSKQADQQLSGEFREVNGRS